MSLQAQAVIVGWHIYALRSDPLLLGLIGLAEAVPAIGFAFFSGYVVDNNRPAFVYRTAVGILVLNLIFLWLAVWPRIPIDDSARIVLLFMGVFISGVVRSFTSPSYFALIATAMPRHLMAETSAWNTWGFQMSAIAGPALGGILYGAFGVNVAFSMAIGCMAAAFFVLGNFSAPIKAARSHSKREPFLASIKAGVQFITKQKVILSSMSLDMFSVLFGGGVAILPMFSDQILKAGSEGLGYLRAAPSVGSGLIAIYLAIYPMKKISGLRFIWMVAGFGLSVFAFAFTTTFTAAFTCLVVSGMFDGASLVFRSTILQLLTPEHMRGRVASLSLIFITSSNEIGAFESGMAAKVLGLIPSLIFNGVMTLGVVGVTAAVTPELRRMRLEPELAS